MDTIIISLALSLLVFVIVGVVVVRDQRVKERKRKFYDTIYKDMFNENHKNNELH